MVYSVDKNFCSKDYVAYTPLTDKNQLIMSADEILFLKIDGKILIDKFNHVWQSDREYPRVDNIQDDECHVKEFFGYNKSYLDFSGDVNSYRLIRSYFFPREEGALLLEEPVSIKEDGAIEVTKLLSRAEIEAEFDRTAYDMMFVFNDFGMIVAASSKKDKLTRGRIIPSDKKITFLDCRNRLWNYQMSKALGDNFLSQGERRQPRVRNIDEIEEMPIYAPIAGREYSHLLLTARHGKFDLKWFKIDFVKKDLFRLTIRPLYIKSSVIDEVIDFCTRNEVESARINVKKKPENRESAGKVLQFRKIGK